MLANDIFSAARLECAVGARSIDTELGEMVTRNASSCSEVAQRLSDGISERYGNNARAVLVGHSYGGYAALEFAHRRPEQLAGLVLLSTQCRADTPGAVARRKKQIALVKAKGITAVLDYTFAAMLPKKSSGSSSDGRPAILEAVKSMALKVGEEAFIRQVIACMTRSDHSETLANLSPDIPVLAVAGGNDQLIPARCAAEMRGLLEMREQKAGGSGNIAPWSSISLANCGHLAPLERPEAFHDAIACWADVVRDHSSDAAQELPMASSPFSFGRLAGNDDAPDASCYVTEALRAMSMSKGVPTLATA
jgi:pimeloyl-ACP methyl ester carboxylesterase